MICKYLWISVRKDICFYLSCSIVFVFNRWCQTCVHTQGFIAFTSGDLLKWGTCVCVFRLSLAKKTDKCRWWSVSTHSIFAFKCVEFETDQVSICMTPDERCWFHRRKREKVKWTAVGEEQIRRQLREEKNSTLNKFKKMNDSTERLVKIFACSKQSVPTTKTRCLS